jgi:glycosyltransferase involved in cell wall biosynthesis
MALPTVSIVMPVYGVERYVADSVRSVLAQTMADFELVVVDDCSPDDSIRIVRGFDDPRIRIVRHDRNRGLAEARNTGIAQARGPFVALLDSDDIAPPHRLATQLAAFDRDPGLIGCGGAMQCIDGVGAPLGGLHTAEIRQERIAPTLLLRNCFFVSSMLFRRQPLAELSYRSEFQMAEDFDLMVRASERGRLSNLPDLLLHYRVHAASLTSTKPRLMDEFRRRIATSQLQRLGISPSAEELDTHMHAAYPRGGVTREQVDAVFVWLKRLSRANDVHRVHAPQALDDVLAASWFEVCTLASGLGPWTMGRYLRESLAGRVGVPPQRWVRFAAKALLGLERKLPQR